MKRPKLWKIRREFARVREQVGRALAAVTTEPLQQALYDRRAGKSVSRFRTGRSLGPNVAIFVLYQPKGLLASTLLTVDHLVGQGWSVFVISNAPLSTTDHTALSQRATAILQRPNVGYDFGAYREGIRYLEQLGHVPDRLILMNDSTWFPLRQTDDTLARMAALNVAMAGHIYKIESSEKRGRDHLESHLLMFDRQMLSSAAFARFWRDYRMSSDRAATVARGEKALTQLALAEGLSVQGLLSGDTLADILSALPDTALLQAVTHTVHHRDDARQLCAALLTDAALGLPWRDRYTDWVRTALSNSRQHLLSATFIDPAMVHGGLGFVKKASDHRHQLGRRAVLRAADEGRIPALDPMVRAEIEQAIARWTPPQDWRKSPGEVRRDEL